MRPTVPVEGVGATFVNGKLVERPEDETAEAVQPEAAQKILMHEVLTITLSWRAPVVRIEGTGPIGHPPRRARSVPDQWSRERQGSHSRTAYLAAKLQLDWSQAHARRTPKQ